MLQILIIIIHVLIHTVHYSKFNNYMGLNVIQAKLNLKPRVAWEGHASLATIH